MNRRKSQFSSVNTALVRLVFRGLRQPGKASARGALSFPSVRYTALVLAACLAVTAATACRGSDPRAASPVALTPVATSSPSPAPGTPAGTAAPLATRPAATPSPTSAPVATGATKTPASQDLTVWVRECQSSFSFPGAGTAGTAPLPTVTPTPASPRQPEAIKSGIAAFYAAAVPVAALADDSSRGTGSRLAAALTAADAATALISHAARLWELCSAAALLPDVPEAAPAAQSLRAALLGRTVWLASAAEQLRCCGLAGVNGLAERQQATMGAFERARKEIESLSSLYGVDTGAVPARKEVSSPILGLSMETPTGWVIMDNSAQIIVLAPGDTRDLTQDTLGPKQWDLGPALRIRRLRTPSVLDLGVAVSRARALLDGLGSLRGERAVTVAGLSAVEQTRVDEAASWQVKVVIAVRGEFTYFFESGYPLKGSGAGAEFDQALATVKFRN